METSKKIPFNQYIAQLLDADHPLAPDYFYRLSDLATDEANELSEVWKKIPNWRRKSIMEEVESLSADDLLLSFVDFSMIALQDEEADIRKLAIQSLWEYDENRLAPIFLKSVKTDPDARVRAAAAGALGRYVYNGEVEELPAHILIQIEEVLLEVVRGEDAPEVRRAALESLGFSSREEAPGLIENAFSSTEKAWIASALFAMGRSCNEAWAQHVISMLSHPSAQVRMEAARAAGELDLKEAIQFLIEMLDDPDDDTRMACIWSLSQLGGEDVRQILEEMLEDAEDEDQLEFIESALDNLEFTESMGTIPLLDFPDDVAGEDLEFFEDYLDDEEDPDE